MQDADKLGSAGCPMVHPEVEGQEPMTHRIAVSIARALRSSDRENVHFHVGSDGRPFVCDYDPCDSPALTPREVGPRHS